MLGKIREAKELKEKYGYKFLIEIDGSCNQRTFKELYEAGAEVFIVGSSGLFSKDKDLKKAWDIMREEFGVKFQSPAANGVIKDEVTLQINVKALEKN